MLDIPTNGLSRDVASYTPDKIAIVPQFSAPQLLLCLGKLLKNYPSRNTFQPLHNLSRTIAWEDCKKYMYMIVQDSLGIDFKSIPFSNLLKNPLQPTRHSLTQNHPTIFRHPHHMLLEIVNSASGSFETHASMDTKFSPLRGLAPFLLPASWEVSKSNFL